MPDIATLTLTPDIDVGSASVDLNVRYPVTTIIQVIASGYVVLHDNYGVYADANWGPGGRVSGSTNVVVDEAFPNGTATAVGFNFNNNQVADTLTMMMYPGYSLYKVQRGLTGGLRRWPWYINNQYVYCDTWTDPPCYTFSGNYLVTVSAPEATFTARADSSTYATGSTATISMTRAPLTIAGNSTPMQVDSALWQAAPDSLGGDAADTVPLNACSNYRWVGTDYVCNHAVIGSGTLTMIGHANGYRVAANVPIAVSGPTLKLTANPNAIAAGDTVTFTPSWSDGYAITVSAWHWRPDTLPSQVTDCTSAQPTCRKTIPQNGWMYVTVLRDGKPRTEKARVTVSPCPTGDHILDEPVVRKKFKQMGDSTHWELPAGAGIVEPDSVGTKKEQDAWIFQRSDGSVYVVDDPLVDVTACTSISAIKTQQDLNALKQNSNDKLIGHAHTHTEVTDNPLYGCGNRNGREYWRGPWDTHSGRLPGFAPVTSNNGGGSDYDWNHANQWNVNEYVIKPGGLLMLNDIPPGDGPQVWTLPPGVDPNQRWTNMTHVVINGNRNPACDWYLN